LSEGKDNKLIRALEKYSASSGFRSIFESTFLSLRALIHHFENEMIPTHHILISIGVESALKFFLYEKKKRSGDCLGELKEIKHNLIDLSEQSFKNGLPEFFKIQLIEGKKFGGFYKITFDDKRTINDLEKYLFPPLDIERDLIGDIYKNCSWNNCNVRELVYLRDRSKSLMPNIINNKGSRYEFYFMPQIKAKYLGADKQYFYTGVKLDIALLFLSRLKEEIIGK